MPTLGAYLYVLNGVKYDLPFVECIQSLSPICEEVIVVTDPRFACDGTVTRLYEQFSTQLLNKQLQLHQITLDLDDPNIDGKTKALGRSLCRADYLIQMDADEVLHSRDYPKIQATVETMAGWQDEIRLCGTGVYNWFNGNHFKLSSLGWQKPRISNNHPNITHGIPGALSIQTPEGYRRCNINKSDGTDYISSLSGERLPVQMTLCDASEPQDDIHNPQAVFVHHYSWYSLPRKWSMKQIWHYFWGLLNGDYRNLEHYHDIGNLDGEFITLWEPTPHKPLAELIDAINKEMQEPSIRRIPYIPHPECMSDWMKRQFIWGTKISERDRYLKV